MKHASGRLMKILPIFVLIASAALCQPYEKWLKEDVAYIIRDDEARAYQQLTTDEDRMAFIDEFWRKRDPNPATATNEAKEEHYRRIAYANIRFAAGVPGWRTDRGRVYIVFGPPASIESHPTATVGNFPFEVWRYPRIEGVGENVSIEFVDANLTGEYKMTLDPNDKQPSMSSRPLSPAEIEKQKKLRERFAPRSN